MKIIYVMGGGSFVHSRNHLTTSVAAFGETAIAIAERLDHVLHSMKLDDQYRVELVLTKMADPRNSNIVTNDDVKAKLEAIIADPRTSGIVFNVAMADYLGTVDGVEPGKYSPRLRTSEGEKLMVLTPTEKIIGLIRKTRKDIFAVGFKTTCGADDGTQYQRGLKLLKDNSLNLVLANDTKTRRNVIIAPEETRYCLTEDRAEVLGRLALMFVSRMQNTFTRSTVVPGEAISWGSDQVPQSLRTVVDHCITKGAYKPFLGKTVGHFATKVNDGTVLTSIRKSNFNHLHTTGLVQIDSEGDHSVIAHGFKPSVGGQSQRIIFREHPGLDCIVHFHCPLKEKPRDVIPSKPQWPNECGSHECGKQTSAGLQEIDLGGGDSLKVVFLSDHGPNIVFNQNIPPEKVISFIEANFDLGLKTGGMVA